MSSAQAVPMPTRFLHCLLILVCIGWTYGPVLHDIRIPPNGARLSSDEDNLFIIVYSRKYQSPTGLASFPDGGVVRNVDLRLSVFRFKFSTHELTPLGETAVPTAVRVSTNALLWSAEQDSAYVLLTGCSGNDGSECDSSLAHRLFVRFYLNRTPSVETISTEPDRNLLSPSAIRKYRTYTDRIELSRPDGEPVANLKVDKKSGLLSFDGT